MRNLLIHAMLGGFFLLLFAGQARPGCKGRQGIEGRIVFESGNQMPGPGVERKPAAGVKRELLVYPLLKADQLQGEGNGFYEEPEETPVKSVSSDNEGRFSVQLAPGRYSLLVREKDKLYGNLLDGDGHVFPVEVTPGEMLEIEFRINYDAIY